MESNFLIKILGFLKNIPIEILWSILIFPLALNIFANFNISLNDFLNKNPLIQPTASIFSIAAFSVLLTNYIGKFKNFLKEKRMKINERKIELERLEKENNKQLHKMLSLSNKAKVYLLNLYFQDHKEDKFTPYNGVIEELISNGLILNLNKEKMDTYIYLTIRISPKTVNFLSEDKSRISNIINSLPSEYFSLIEYN